MAAAQLKALVERLESESSAYRDLSTGELQHSRSPSKAAGLLT